MSALIALSAVAALVVSAAVQWVVAETTGTQMQEWRDRW